MKNTSDNKSKRRVRRHNKIAKDLRTPKYRQRVREGKPKYVPEIKEDDIDDWYFSLDRWLDEGGS